VLEAITAGAEHVVTIPRQPVVPTLATVDRSIVTLGFEAAPVPTVYATLLNVGMKMVVPTEAKQVSVIVKFIVMLSVSVVVVPVNVTIIV
jgi:hypothetical protein